MKLSALIHRSVLDFILKDNTVINTIGPIDKNPNYSTSSIEMKIIQDQDYPVVIECLFFFHRLNDTIQLPPAVRVVVNWLDIHRFSLNSVEYIHT